MSELIDTDTKYCDVSDVEFYIREKIDTVPEFVNESRIQQKIKEQSEKIDKKSGKAWRTRQENDEKVRLELNHQQEKRFEGGNYLNISPHNASNWVKEKLKRRDIEEIVSIEIWRNDGNYESVENENYYIEKKQGNIKINMDEIYTYPNSNLSNVKNKKTENEMKITYKYGKTRIQDDIKEACAKMTAAEIIKTDIYGSTITDDTNVDLNTVVEDLTSDAKETIENHKYKPVKIY